MNTITSNDSENDQKETVTKDESIIDALSMPSVSDIEFEPPKLDNLYFKAVDFVDIDE